MAELKIGEISKPRFEFCSFGQCFCEAHKRMARLSVPVPKKVWERHSDKIYIISNKNDINGAKIVTINSESTEIEDINYLQAIKRVIGMSDKPLANE